MILSNTDGMGYNIGFLISVLVVSIPYRNFRTELLYLIYTESELTLQQPYQ